MLIWELFILLGLLALRIGVPLAVIGLITWWLTRLDRKWQAEPIVRPDSYAEVVAAASGAALRDGAEPESRLRRPIIQVPCWVFRACPPERCGKCAVYKAQGCDQPCWRIHLTNEGRLPPRCRTCAIFATTVAEPTGAAAD